MRDPRKAVRTWWRSLPLKRQAQWRLAQDAAYAATGVFVVAGAWLSPVFGQTIGMTWGAMFTGAMVMAACRRWRALRSPLFYLAAVKHDLADRPSDGGDMAGRVARDLWGDDAAS